MNILRKLSLPATILLLWSCAPDQYGNVSEYDDIYFSSTDLREVNYSSLVENNEPQNFSSFHNNAENVQMENFSAKNVNPDYIARYANQSSTSSENFGSDDYFVEDYGNNGINNQRNFASQGQNTTYNNYRITNNNGFGGGFSPFSMGMGMAMSPWGMGGFGMNPWNMGGFGMTPFGYDPFFDPFFPRAGFRTGFSMGFGFNSFGFGNTRIRHRLAMSYGWGNPFFMDPWMMDPWMSPLGFNSFAFNRFGAFGSPFGFGNRFYSPVVIINNSDAPRQQYVRGPRDGRSSQFANAATSGVPITRSAVAAQRSNAGTNQVTSQRRDFTQTQNEYYRSSRRSLANSSASASRNSASAITSNTRRNYIPSNVATSRRSSSANYGRPATSTTSRSNSVFNNSSTRSRMGTSTPPSRSSTMSTGGASRSSSGGSIGRSSSSSGGGATRSSGGGRTSSSGGRGGR